MSLTFNINVKSEPTRTVVNKFYPYWVYVTSNSYVTIAKQALESTIKEMQKCQ